MCFHRKTPDRRRRDCIAGERNYHIFYHMRAGCSPEEKALYKIRESNADYTYTLGDPKYVTYVSSVSYVSYVSYVSSVSFVSSVSYVTYFTLGDPKCAAHPAAA